ncbi:MAG: PD40 domain-containing protein [Gemmatimonadetes bacterium]|nr:PD40 domain-containing protein [Gemmatimonadota bacterium]
MSKVRLPMLLLALCAALPLGAQGYFGQNQVQFERFNWKILKTEHFDIHYYPEEARMAHITGSLAERSYARLSRLMNYQFKERKPIIVFASRGAFAQNNVFGDPGEGTGGITDALRQRNMFFYTGDLGEAEHVMTHEMVHQFQYDMFSRGKAGQGLETLQQRQPPLWFVEGMAEYLSVGPDHPATDGVVRDAALSGKFPTVENLERRPDQFFPYRYGESLWRYVGSRWGDEIVGEIMQSTPTLGHERAIKRHTGLSLEELGSDWKDAMQSLYLPQVERLDRPRKIATSLLTERKTGGVIPVYVAPALSPDGKYIAYISTGSLVKAEVFLDLYLADATTGKRLKRLTKSTLNPEFEELRYAYSQSAFSRDGRFVVFTAQRGGKDVLYIADVRNRDIVRRLDTGLDAMIGASWSPDGRQIVFSGHKGGISDLYVVDADGKNLRKLTNDLYGDLMPAWSPDGKKVAFVSERGPQTELDVLKFGRWRVSVLDLASGNIEVLPGQAGKNLNPQWAPDGKSLAFISDREGIPQIFLFDFANEQHYQLTRLVGGVQSVTENSPALTWAPAADRMAFVYSEGNGYTVWQVNNPRSLKGEPYRPSAVVVAAPGQPTVPQDTAEARRMRDRAAAQANVSAIVAPAAAGRDSLLAPAAAAQQARDPRRQSVYRGESGLRPTDKVPERVGAPGAGVSVASLLDNATFALPDTTKFKETRYPGSLRPEYIARPQVGYAQDNYGRGVYGGTAVVLRDLVGNRQLTLAGSINGRVEEAQVFAAYQSMARRFQYAVGVQQQPSFFLVGSALTPVSNTQAIQEQALARYIQRSAFLAGSYPLNRFKRFELGMSANNIDRSLMFLSYGVDYAYGYTTQMYIDSIVNISSLNFVAPYAAFVHDNSIFGLTGPIYGQRYRFEIERAAGNLSWTNYNADYRRYDALLFSYLTLATRVQTAISAGGGENEFPKYIGRADLIRGYDRENYYSNECESAAGGTSGCSATQLLGSRVAIANAELRFPVIRPFHIKRTLVQFLPVDGLVFFDAGAAWNKGQSVSFSKPANYDWQTQRYAMRSYGFGFRLNLFNIAILRIDKSYPLDAASKKGYWFWTVGPSF